MCKPNNRLDSKYLNASLIFETLMKPNKEVLIDNLSIGQLYVIEIIPNITSNHCKTLCPYIEDDIFMPKEEYSCEKCKKMEFFLFNKEKLQFESPCFDNIQINTDDQHTYSVGKVHLVADDTPIIFPLDILDHVKNHFCPIEESEIIIPYKELFISFVIILILVGVISIFKYLLILYGKLFSFSLIVNPKVLFDQIRSIIPKDKRSFFCFNARTAL
jgi:hypothetical protein